jgi:hypothetical protein
MNDPPNTPLIKSYAWHGDKCFFVSTIERTYETYVGEIRGVETLVWDFEWDARKRGDLIGQSDERNGHEGICRCLIDTGEMRDNDNPKHERYY